MRDLAPAGKPGDKSYVLYFSRRWSEDPNGDRVMVWVFYHAFVARKFLDVALGDEGFIWEDDCTVRTEGGTIVSTRWHPEDMRAVWEHEYTLPELGWDLSSNMPMEYRCAMWWRHGAPTETEEEVVQRRAAKRERKTSSSPRASAPPGYIHVSTIALQLGVDAKQARVALRKIYGDNKPKHGWNFAPDEVESVKAKIKENIR